MGQRLSSLPPPPVRCHMTELSSWRDLIKSIAKRGLEGKIIVVLKTKVSSPHPKHDLSP